MTHIISNKDYNKEFEAYLQRKFDNDRPRALQPSHSLRDYTFSHPGLNCRYGLELEFLSSSNRFVIGSRNNSCMYEKQHPFWRKNFDAFRDIDPNLPGDGRAITNTTRNFNQWSSFFFEIVGYYGSKTHKGDHRCGNRGIAGIKIENDSSVVLENTGPGIILWSSTADKDFDGSELKHRRIWKPNCIGLDGQHVYIEPRGERRMPNCTVMPYSKHFVLFQNKLQGGGSRMRWASEDDEDSAVGHNWDDTHFSFDTPRWNPATMQFVDSANGSRGSGVGPGGMHFFGEMDSAVGHNWPPAPGTHDWLHADTLRPQMTDNQLSQLLTSNQPVEVLADQLLGPQASMTTPFDNSRPQGSMTTPFSRPARGRTNQHGTQTGSFFRNGRRTGQSPASPQPSGSFFRNARRTGQHSTRPQPTPPRLIPVPMVGLGGEPQENLSSNINTWNADGRTLQLEQANELVTNVLTNDYINYPLCIKPRNVEPGILPLGSLIIENTINHMISHTTVIATQRMAFHVHLSEFPSRGRTRRENSAIGFVKLFYLFEPLLFSLVPYFRSRFSWNQSLQSLYNYKEIKEIEYHPDILFSPHCTYRFVTGDEYQGSTRLLQGKRYLAVNLQNIYGSGTIEVRIGNAGFDSHYIQAYINILQTLYTFSNYLLDLGAANLFEHHNKLLEKYYDLIPHYCLQTTSNYNIQRHPFFFDNFGTNARKTEIITNLYRVFIELTDCQALSSIRDYITYYHCRETSWINKISMDDIDFDSAEDEAKRNVGRRRFNIFRPLIAGEHYRTNSTNINRFVGADCKNCYRDTRTRNCVRDFNNGIRPQFSGNERRPGDVSDQKDQSKVFYNWCRGDRADTPNYSKVQKELIHRVIQQGGSNSESPKIETDFKDRLNKGVYKIIIKQNNANMEIGYVDWMGTFYKEDGLTEIIKKLLNKKIITREQLNILVEKKYIDYCIFKREHKAQLIDELKNIKNLNITESKINEIIEIYTENYEKYKKLKPIKVKGIMSNSGVTKLSKGQLKFQPSSSSNNRLTKKFKRGSSKKNNLDNNTRYYNTKNKKSIYNTNNKSNNKSNNKTRKNRPLNNKSQSKKTYKTNAKNGNAYLLKKNNIINSNNKKTTTLIS